MDNLTQITKAILQCQRCELRMTATRPVPGHGDLGAKYFLLGEAPGREEDSEGVPFVGQAGRRLDKLLELAGININDCYLSNVCRCRPPSNRTPRKKEIRACVDFLWQEIKLVQPQVIITLGSTPLSLFCPHGVTQVHGTMMDIDLDKIINAPEPKPSAKKVDISVDKQRQKKQIVEVDYASVLSELFSGSD